MGPAGPVAPKTSAGDSGGQQEADIIEQKAVRIVAAGGVVVMGKDVDDQHTPVGEEQRGVYKHHRVLEAGMFHFLPVFQQPHYAIPDNDGDTRSEDQE